ncbi:MAG: hypothetical protein N2445_07660 [Acidobacteria bacterium]|nr:hypothetical protein [Acidobacteriota bacterium]
MIRKILDLIRQKGFISLSEIEKETGLTKEVVCLLLEELEKRGKIKSCSSLGESCENCFIRERCSDQGKKKIYFWGETIK